jgi:hypothetical protein
LRKDLLGQRKRRLQKQKRVFLIGLTKTSENQIVQLLEFESSEAVLVAPTFVLNEISYVHQQITNILALDRSSIFGSVHIK